MDVFLVFEIVQMVPKSRKTWHLVRIQKFRKTNISDLHVH